MRERGLTVESINGDVHLDPDRLHAGDTPADFGPVELVLVATKTYQLDDAARQMLPLLGPDTQVLPLLNGVEAGVAEQKARPLRRRQGADGDEV